MKKRVCLFLCLVLLCSMLAGCASQTNETTEPSGTDADVSATEPASEPAVPLSFSLGSLPAIGTFVTTEKGEAFFPDGPRDTFEPRDDYGKVVPYCAGSKRYFAVDWSFTDEETGEVYSGTTPETEEEYCGTYGFATADGKLITNGAYADVLWASNGRGDGFYAAFQEQTYEMQGKADLIAPDGSWYLHFDKEVYLEPLKYRSFSDPALFMVADEHEVVLYSYRGERVLDVTRYRDANNYTAKVLYIDGEKLLVENWDMESGTGTYTLFDYSGNKLGRLPATVERVDDVFSDGVLLVDIGGDRVQLMDIHGKALSEPYYEMKYSKKDDCFLARTEYDDSPVIILDKQGKEMKTLDVFYNTVEGENGNLWIFDESEYTFYDFDGTPTVMDTDGQEIVDVQGDITDWQSEDRVYYYYAETASGELYLFDTSGNRVAKLNDVSYTNYEDSWGDTEKNYQIFLENGTLICQKKGEIELLNLSTGKTLSVPYRDEKRYRWTNILSGRIAAVGYQMDDDYHIYTYDIYDMETGKLLFTNAVFTNYFASFVLVATKTESVLLDETATPVLRIQNDTLI